MNARDAQLVAADPRDAEHLAAVYTLCSQFDRMHALVGKGRLQALVGQYPSALHFAAQLAELLDDCVAEVQRLEAESCAVSLPAPPA